jgi:tetratricopeptide (TPR) repeat protein
VPHWFDAQILAALLEKDPEECAALYAELQGLPVVEPIQAREGHNVHEVTRTAMLARLWDERRDEYVALSARAAAYFGQGDAVEMRIEEIYHLLVADPDAGAEALYSQGWTWHDSPLFAYDRVYALAGAALEHAAAGRLDRRGAGTAQLLSGVIDTTYWRNREAMGKLEAARQAGEQDSQLRADSNFRLGDVHRMLAEYAEARDRYEEARPIYAAIGDRLGEANCILGTGNVARSEEDWSAAEHLFRSALTTYREIGMPYNTGLALQRLGSISENRGARSEAASYYEEALAIFERIGVKDVVEWIRAEVARCGASQRTEKAVMLFQHERRSPAVRRSQ